MQNKPSIRTKSREKIILGLSNYTHISINRNDTRNTFCKRLLLHVHNNLSMQEIAEICSVNKTLIFRAFHYYGIASPTRKRATRLSKRTSKQEDRRKYSARKYDYAEVRKLIIELKSVKQVALRLGAPTSSIQDIINRNRAISPKWLIYRCEFCFSDFVPRVVSQKYCSKKCNTERQNYLRRVDCYGMNIKHRNDMIVCEKCGNNVKTIEKHSDYQIKYCPTCRVEISKHISRNSARKKLGITKDYGMEISCDVCGTKFVIKTVGDMRRKYCSDKCYKYSKKRQYKEKQMQPR